MSEIEDDRIRKSAEVVVDTWRSTLNENLQRELYGDLSYRLKDLIEEAIVAENKLTQLRCMPE